MCWVDKSRVLVLKFVSGLVWALDRELDFGFSSGICGGFEFDFGVKKCHFLGKKNCKLFPTSGVQRKIFAIFTLNRAYLDPKIKPDPNTCMICAKISPQKCKKKYEQFCKSKTYRQVCIFSSSG